MADCNTLSMRQNRFLRTLEDAKRLLKFKIKFEVEEITSITDKSDAVSLYDFDKAKFIEHVHQVNKE